MIAAGWSPILGGLLEPWDRGNADQHGDVEHWLEHGCPHEDMEFLREEIGAWAGVRYFQQALREADGSAFPTLLRYLPKTNDGWIPAAEVPAVLAELDHFEHRAPAGPDLRPSRRCRRPRCAGLMFTTVEMLADQPFLAGLTEHQLGLLAPLTSRSMFHAGNRIFGPGTPAEQFWLITDGRVYLDAEVPGYDNFVLEALKPGAVLGWSWLFPPYRWHFGAVATSTAHTLTFNGPLVRALCQRDPALGFELTSRFLLVMGERLQSARSRLQDCQRAAGHRNDV